MHIIFKHRVPCCIDGYNAICGVSEVSYKEMIRIEQPRIEKLQRRNILNKKQKRPIEFFNEINF